MMSFFDSIMCVNVSILVLVDVALRLARNAFYTINFIVSILVLVDVALRLQRPVYCIY